jgi:predicted transposase/invertase (TIGR01784 family)
MKTLQEVNLDNDFLFAKVMADTEICKMVLETILRINIEKVELLVEQNTIQNILTSKGVRLDVYVKDDKGSVFVCEMQTGKGKELPKRTRYYQGNIDLDLLSKGERYVDLKRSYIIFICTFDPFGQNRYCYTFEETCTEDKSLLLGDETKKIFLNTKGQIGEADSALRDFLGYVEHSTQEYANTVTSDLVKAVHDKVTTVKENKEMEAAFMKTLLWEQETRDEAWQQGLQEGRQEEREYFLSLLKQDLTTEEIQERLNSKEQRNGSR